MKSRLGAVHIQRDAEKLVTGSEAESLENEFRLAIASRLSAFFAVGGAAAIAAVSSPQLESAALSHFAHEEIAADALIADGIRDAVQGFDAEDFVGWNPYSD